MNRFLIPLALAAALLNPLAVAWAENPMVWGVFSEGGVWRLGFMPEESDDTAIDFTCRPASGKVGIEVPVSFDWRGKTIDLASGPASGSYRVHLEEDGEIFDQWAVAQAPSSDRVLAAFARTGRLRFRDGQIVDASSPKERAEIARFFKTCGEGHTAPFISWRDDRRTGQVAQGRFASRSDGPKAHP